MSGATQLRVYLIDKGFELILLMKLQNVHDSCRRPDWSLAQWQESLVKLPYSIGFLKNNEKFKHLAYDTLQMKVPGVERTEADIYRIAEECQRGS